MNTELTEDLTAFIDHVGLINRFVEMVERRAKEMINATGKLEGAYPVALVELQGKLNGPRPIETYSTLNPPIVKERATELLSQRFVVERNQPFPIWIRAPSRGTEPFTGLSRGKLYQLATDRKIKSVSLREPGQANGVRLFNLPSILAYIESKEASSTP